MCSLPEGTALAWMSDAQDGMPTLPSVWTDKSAPVFHGELACARSARRRLMAHLAGHRSCSTNVLHQTRSKTCQTSWVCHGLRMQKSSSPLSPALPNTEQCNHGDRSDWAVRYSDAPPIGSVSFFLSGSSFMIAGKGL